MLQLIIYIYIYSRVFFLLVFMYYVGAFTATKYVRERYKSDITFTPKSMKNICAVLNGNRSALIDKERE